MHGQAEGAPVHRQKRAATQQRMGLQRMRRAEVDVTPGRVEGADLQHHQVKRAQQRADQRVFAGQPGIAREKHRMPVGAQHHRGPQRGVAVLQATAGEVLRRRGRHRQPAAVGAGQRTRFPPVQLGDARGRHSPALQVGTHTQRGDDRHLQQRQRADGGVVEVVVVVMRDDHHIHSRQRLQGHWHRLKPLGAGQPRRGCTRAPHRVGQHPQAVDFQQHGGVAQPGGAQASLRRLAPGVQRVDHRQRATGHTPLTSTQKIHDRRHGHRRIAQAGLDRMQVAEAVTGPAR